MSRNYGVVGKFVALDVNTLTVMLSQWQNCLTKISTLQVYSMAGRTFTYAQLAEVSEMIAEISFALKLNSGRLVRTTYSDMS